MLIRRFLTWIDRASAGERASATSALANVFLYADLAAPERGEVEGALTSLLDDPSPNVRHALAEAFADRLEAPYPIVLALAADLPEIAALVLGRSPVLTEADLVDALAVGDAVAQAAVASRSRVSARVSFALADAGEREAVLALCGNCGIALEPRAIRRVLERFGRDGAVREALHRRADLDPAERHALVAATAEALRAFVADRNWMRPERARRAADEARDRATMRIGGGATTDADAAGALRFVAHLRATGHLTPALVLRALLSGRHDLFEAALCDLSGQSPRQVAGHLRRGGLGFAALYTRAGLPAALRPAFQAALAGAIDLEGGAATPGDPRLGRRAVGRVVAACRALEGTESAAVLALLRRFESEAAREEARAFARAERRPTSVVVTPTLERRRPAPDLLEAA